jgi:hypothetical protein
MSSDDEGSEYCDEFFSTAREESFPCKAREGKEIHFL